MAERGQPRQPPDRPDYASRRGRGAGHADRGPARASAPFPDLRALRCRDARRARSRGARGSCRGHGGRPRLRACQPRRNPAKRGPCPPFRNALPDPRRTSGVAGDDALRRPPGPAARSAASAARPQYAADPAAPGRAALVELGRGTRGVTAAQPAKPMPLKFEIGARTLMAVQRSLARAPLRLDEAREGRLPQLPPLEREAHGYSVTSLPEDRQAAMVYASGGMLPFVRQRYTRYFIDFAVGFDGWFEGLSSNARQSLRRKAKKIAAESGGDLDVRRFTTPDQLDAFHGVGRRVAAAERPSELQAHED